MFAHVLVGKPIPDDGGVNLSIRNIMRRYV